MVLPVPTGVAQKSSNVGASHHQRCSKKQLRWCFIPPPLHKKAAALLPHTTNSAQKSSSVGASYHLHCTKKQRRCYLAPPTVPKKAATVVPGGSNVGGGGINGFLVADGDQPLSVASRHRPGPGPAAGPLLCVAKEVGKKGDPAEPVVCFAADCLALLTTGGRRRTRGLRPLRQLRRTSPPVAPLLSGSEGAFSRYRAFTGTAGVIDEFVHPSSPCKVDAIVAVPDRGMSGYALRANPTYHAI